MTTCSFRVSLLFDLSIKLLSELMILSSALMNSRFVVDFGLRKRGKFWFSIFDLRRSHLWSYWVFFFFFFFFFLIKCMQSMTMTLSRRCMYAKLHVIWSKSLLYIFSLINHIDSLRIQALFLNFRHRTFVFLCSFALFTFYSFVSNSHFLVAIRVFFKYSSVAILSILVMNSVNIVSVFLSWAFFLSFICSAL